MVPPGADWSSPLQVEPPLYTQGRAEGLWKIIQRDSIKRFESESLSSGWKKYQQITLCPHFTALKCDAKLTVL